MPRYLSLDWIDALTAEVAASDARRELASTTSIGVTQVITDGPEGDVVYHLQVGGGSASFGAGPADPEDVRFDENWDTAVAVATGDLNAQEAFIKGRIRLTGDHGAAHGERAGVRGARRGVQRGATDDDVRVRRLLRCPSSPKCKRTPNG